MALQTARLSVWFRSQLQQKQNQWLQTRRLNLFNLFGFSRPEPLQVFNKSGRAVLLNTTSLEDDEEGATLNVDLSIENDYSPSYSPTTDVIIRNYSSSLTYSEIESMITMQKHATNCNPNKCVIGRTFAGIIESIPDKLLADKHASDSTFPFEIGDRVWGTSTSTFGHCWSDYVPVSYKSLCHAPINIPLHFCGLYPLQLYNLQTLLNYAKININDLKHKRVLFIGTGRRSMINIFVPFLKHLDANNNITIIDDKKHCRLDANILDNYLKIDAFHTFDESMDELDDVDNALEASFDLVFDSMAMDKTEIMDNCKFVKPKGVYFWRQNHMAQFGDNISFGKWRIAFKGARFLQECDRDIKKQFDGIKFVPDMRPNVKEKAKILDSFTSYLTEMSFPIIIDKMYNLNDIQSAFNYAFNNDDNMLGENIGIVIQKENGYSDDMFFEEGVRPKTIKLPPIDNLYHKYQSNKNKNNNIESCIDDIIEHETSSSSNPTANNDYGFVQDKPQILESQTIAKNTSNKT